jgi:uncharacterized membrane protein
MPTSTVWKFDSANGAHDALGMLEQLRKQQLITISDAAHVYRRGPEQVQDQGIWAGSPAPEPWVWPSAPRSGR